MKNKFTSTVLFLGGCLTGALIFGQTSLQAQTALNNNISAFSTPSGLVGFFDPSQGRVYLYDSNLENCILISQISELGQRAKKIK